MTLTFELDLDRVNVNQYAKCLCQSHLVQKLLSGDTNTDTHRTDCSTWTTEVVGNKKVCSHAHVYLYEQWIIALVCSISAVADTNILVPGGTTSRQS